jgi:peptide/nickel transport system substrate-binding protein
VGTGPFLFQEYVPQDHLILARNPDYAWAPEVYQHNGPTYLDEIEFRFYPEPATRALALEAGEADVVGEIPPQDAQRLGADPGFALHEVPIPGQPLQFFLNTERPPTDDLRVRQALLYATDRERLVDTVFRRYSPVAHGPLAAVTFAYDPAVEDTYPYDLARAEALLEEAGWVDDDGDGVRERDGQRLQLTLVLMNWGSLAEVGQILQAQWGALGVEVRSQIMAFPAAVETAARGEHNLAPMTLFNSDPSILNSTFLAANADGGFNWAKWRDPELDRLLVEATRTLDREARAELYAQVQRKIMDAALILPLREYVQLNGARAAVRGLRFDARGWFPWLYDVWLAE